MEYYKIVRSCQSARTGRTREEATNRAHLKFFREIEDWNFQLALVEHVAHAASPDRYKSCSEGNFVQVVKF
uniref:Uncharacterized protein n=1 Tax=Trichogramma kaykai TaxID=54128 RepID=A0ABD2WCQ0_9HYME